MFFHKLLPVNSLHRDHSAMLYSRDDRNLRYPATAFLLLLLACVDSCDSAGDTDRTAAGRKAAAEGRVAEEASSPTVDNSLPEELQGFRQPWQGGFDGMV